MASLSDFIAVYRTMGPARFFCFMAIIIAIGVGTVGVYEWLSIKLGWPDRYGLYCDGRECLWVELFHSGRLLYNGRWDELLLFVWLWSIPGIFIVAAAIVLMKRRTTHRRNRIKPMR